ALRRRAGRPTVDRAAHAGRGDRTPRAARARLPPECLVPRDGGVVAAAPRPGALPGGDRDPDARARRGRARPGAGRALAQLPGALPGVEPAPQADAARLAPAVGEAGRGRRALARGAHPAVALAGQLPVLARHLRRPLSAAPARGALPRADRGRYVP